MSEIPPPFPADPGYSRSPNGPQPGGIDLRMLLHITYGLYAIGFITGGLGALAAIVLVYIKRGDAVGTIYSSHFSWLLSTFWWSLLWGLISTALTVIVIGWIGLFVTLVWVLYRIVKGWLALAENKAVGSAY